MSTPTATYSERLRPSAGAWLLVPVAALMAGAAAFPLGIAASIVAGALLAAVAVVLLVRRTPVVRVDDAGLHAGPALLEPACIGEVEALDATATRAALGPQLRADAFVVHRPWVRTAVRVQVDDEADTTPYWVVSASDPQALAAALVTCRDSSGRRTGQAAHSEQTGWPRSS